MSDQLELASEVQAALEEAGIGYKVRAVYPDTRSGTLEIELLVFDK